MATLHLSLPEPLHEFIERQVAEGGYGTANEYITALLQKAQEQKMRDTIDSLLREGLESGEPTEVTQEYWEAKHQRLTEKYLGTNEQ